MSVTHNLDNAETFEGPYNLTVYDDSDPETAVAEFTGRKKDSMNFAVENELTDENEVGLQEIIAKILNAEGTFSEVITADLEALDNGPIGKIELELPLKGKTITVQNPQAFTSVDNWKSKIQIKKREWADSSGASYPYSKASTT